MKIRLCYLITKLPPLYGLGLILPRSPIESYFLRRLYHKRNRKNRKETPALLPAKIGNDTNRSNFATLDETADLMAKIGNAADGRQPYCSATYTPSSIATVMMSPSMCVGR